MSADELLPVSNSFDFEPARSLADFTLDAERCSARPLGLDRARTSRVLIAHIEGRFALCRTQTSNFTTAEVREYVHDCGQLYLDVSGKPAVTDFAADVRQLVVSAECRKCRSLPTCVACYELAPRSFFEEDEEWLRAELSRLRGRVLDVGLGHVPYLDAFADLVRSGDVEYHGLDPDPVAIAAASASDLPLRLHHGVIEEFAGFDGAIDHVIAIRSLNHFLDIDTAFARIAAGLRPGGSLLVIESIPLPLLRSRRHARLCHEAQRGGFQHFRNWDSHRTLHAIRRFPFQVKFHRPVGRDTCDQWLLTLERA
ncbi:MAG: class I SAM-dependent methyltransferase [Deltaproteobacteria bacterium]|nr:class I SAM-dependent methyltransferase [Deltaproteobacteria bacterium]